MIGSNGRLFEKSANIKDSVAWNRGTSMSMAVGTTFGSATEPIKVQSVPFWLLQTGDYLRKLKCLDLGGDDNTTDCERELERQQPTGREK